MAKEKTTSFYFKMSPHEAELLENRMQITGISNKSAFIRKMCIDGFAIRLDVSVLNEIGRLLHITSNNVNQLAHHANCGDPVAADEVTKVGEQLTDIRKQFGDVLDSLSGISGAMPGNRFIPPPKITDFEEGA